VASEPDWPEVIKKGSEADGGCAGKEAKAQ
jgi:hypothetical protein